MTLNNYIELKSIHHRGQDRLGLFFKYDEKIIKSVKSLSNRRYSVTLKCWHIPKTKKAYNELQRLNHPLDISNISSLEKYQEKKFGENTLNIRSLNKLQKFEEYLEMRRYSRSTIESYISILKLFFVWFKKTNQTSLDIHILNSFNHEYFIKGKYSKSYQNIWTNAIKLYLDKFTNHQIDLRKIERPRKSSKLPTVLSTKEVKLFLNSFSNVKHKAIMMTIYACGLRKSEITHLKLRDIDGERNVIRVRNSKGAKDRDLAFPKELKKILQAYYLKYKPKEFLFNGASGGMYSTSSIDKLIKSGVKKAKLNKYITTHSLRHSYATHLVENNVNLRFIQDALGHKSSTTTEIYTKLSKDQISNMLSPIDFWEDNKA